MNRPWALLLLGLLLLLPVAANAQSNIPLFDPEWQLVPEAHELDQDCPVGAPLGFGGVLQLIQNVMNAAISFGVLIFLLVIVFAGILWILTPTNPENHSQAKKVLTNAVIGLLIILSAWLIVDFVMKILYSGTNGQQGVFGPWNEILTGGDICVVAGDVRPLFDGSITAVPGITTSGGTSGGGSCTVPTNQNNPCSVTRLQQTCFASRATDASKICMVESSGGQAAVCSGSDKLNSGSGPSYSCGLWQINLTVHRIGNLNCPAAFTNAAGTASSCSCGGDNLIPGRIGACRCQLKSDGASQRLYSQCVVAARDPVRNTEVACRLYEQDGANGGFQPWRHTATQVCRVPLR
ncbi:MAG TPA: pilin [Candidatus Paceibacterota bacterium]|nr:pilin [Candidatus Paceibacterota bacterium]